MKAGIYKIQHKESGRIYIGSSVDYKLRLRKHLEILRRGQHCNSALQNAFNAYGKEAFEFKLILVCDPENLLMYEQCFMDYYKSYIKPHGYNIRKKAESNAGIESKRLQHKAGDKYNRLTLISLYEKNPNGNKWLCECDCGNRTIASVSNVKYGSIRSCGCIKTEMLKISRNPKPNSKYGRLTLISPCPEGKGLWLAKCDCGKEIKIIGNYVKRGGASSCGCYRSEMMRERITEYNAKRNQKRRVIDA